MKNQIQELKQGDLFKRKPGAKRTYVRGPYCRFNRKYECTAYDDINQDLYLKKGTEIFEL